MDGHTNLSEPDRFSLAQWAFLWPIGGSTAGGGRWSCCGCAVGWQSGQAEPPGGSAGSLWAGESRRDPSPDSGSTVGLSDDHSEGTALGCWLNGPDLHWGCWRWMITHIHAHQNTHTNKENQSEKCTRCVYHYHTGHRQQRHSYSQYQVAHYIDYKCIVMHQCQFPFLSRCRIECVNSPDALFRH
jgi:hypothetical protein